MLQRLKQLPHNSLFYLVGAIYVWLAIEPCLIYHSFDAILPNAPPFMTGWSFLKESIGVPGGFIGYVSGFLSQGYCYSWLGALIIMGAALGLGELSRRHFMKTGHGQATVLTSLPAVLVFLIYSRYKHPLPLCLGLGLGLACSLLFERLRLRQPMLRMGLYALMAGVMFWAAGTGGLLVFTAMTLVYGIFVHRAWGLVTLTLPASLVIAWGLGQYLFLIPPQQAFSILTPMSPAVYAGMTAFTRILTILLYGVVPLTVLLLLMAQRLFKKPEQTRARRKKKDRRKKTSPQRRFSLALLRGPALASIPFVLLASALYLGHDNMKKPFLLDNYYARQKQWNQVLELSRRLPKGQTNVYFNHDIVRALFHTGRLPYDMFHFPQTPYGILLNHESRESYLTQLKLCDVFMELGQVNQAEKLASEILATRGYCGIVLEKLAWIYLCKGQRATARIYLNILTQDLNYRAKAETLLRSLNHGLTPDQTAYIGRIRSLMCKANEAGPGLESVEKTLTSALAYNPQNKMAFEYLMACYLTTRQLDKIVVHLERLPDLGYEGIPTLYEEALLIHVGSQGRQVDLNKYPISPKTIQRYTKFVQLRKALQSQNRQAVLNRLVTEYGRSYFFYFVFGQVGVV